MQVHLKNVRLAFAAVHEPREQLNGGHKYEANLLFADPENIAAVKQAMLAVATEMWKDKAKAVLSSLEKSRSCFRDGNKNTNSDGEVYNGFAGQQYVVAKSKTRPTVIDQRRTPLVAADGKPYNGCYVNAIIDVYATAKREAGGNGVFAELKGIQFWKDGDAFGGASTPVSAEAFDIAEDDTATASGAGGGDLW